MHPLHMTRAEWEREQLAALRARRAQRQPITAEDVARDLERRLIAAAPLVNARVAEVRERAARIVNLPPMRRYEPPREESPAPESAATPAPKPIKRSAPWRGHQRVAEAKRTQAQDRRDAVERLTKEGKSGREIAEALGISAACVALLRGKLGLTQPPPPVTDAEEEGWVLSYQRGVSIVQISKEVGRNDKTIRKALKRRGIEIHLGGPRKVVSEPAPPREPVPPRRRRRAPRPELALPVEPPPPAPEPELILLAQPLTLAEPEQPAPPVEPEKSPIPVETQAALRRLAAEGVPVKILAKIYGQRQADVRALLAGGAS